MLISKNKKKKNRKPTFPYGALPGDRPTPQFPAAPCICMGQEGCPCHPQCDHSHQMCPCQPVQHCSLPVSPQVSTALSGLEIAAEKARPQTGERTADHGGCGQKKGEVGVAADSQKASNSDFPFAPRTLYLKSQGRTRMENKIPHSPASNMGPLARPHHLACIVD